MPSATIHVRPATEDDAVAIGRVHHAALSPYHDFYRAFFARDPEEIMPLSTRLALNNAKNKFLVAIFPQTNIVAGFVRYHIAEATDATEEPTVPASPARSAAEKPENQPSLASLFAVKPHLKELWGRYGHPRETEMDESYEKVMDGRRHIYVKHIMVDPQHQRKGIGAKLLEAVVDFSDAKSLPTFLVSSAEGHGLYERLDFRDVGSWTIDNGFWAKEIVQIEHHLGLKGNEGLAERFEGVSEVEIQMIREN
ncbi:hypothetical protein CTRI78_v003504 [Colletotrichum trifolii]|uniref:N-acetyltransferase domain-containing protein n=1 Tax=Colletotrichum trifolii TaxID=5466 RepID=A0A4R8RNQ5_COLTR|nr:hypothetical protein CTRI78_v003504 [Colletotrichum trifolii]